MAQFQHLIVSLTDEQVKDAQTVAHALGHEGNVGVMLKSLLQSTIDGHKALTEDGD